MTYREIVNMINDELKQENDDSWYTLDHIKFLCDKYRSNILKKLYLSKMYTDFDRDSYQTLCFDLERTGGGLCRQMMLRTSKKVPDMLIQDLAKVLLPDNYGSAYIALVPWERMLYTGHNKWMRNIIYCSFNPDKHLYFNSMNGQFLGLQHIRVTGIFSDPEAAAKLECNPDNDDSCDIMDKQFPLVDYLVPQLILLVVKELSQVQMRPEDNVNNASDDMSNMEAYIRSNVKKQNIPRSGGNTEANDDDSE